jgi:hypothetical protein
MMEWVARLPEVGTPLLRRVERIGAVLVEANDLQKKAVELQQAAYLESLQLERDVAVKWTADEINRARAAAAVPS